MPKKKNDSQKNWDLYSISSAILNYFAEGVEDLVMNSSYVQRAKRRVRAKIFFFIMLLVAAIIFFEGISIFLSTLMQIPQGLSYIAIAIILLIVAYIYRIVAKE